MNSDARLAPIPRSGLVQCLLCRDRHNRHTYASLMLMLGADPRYVQQQLGHESVSTTYRYYAHWMPKEARASYANLIELPETIAEASTDPIPCTNSVSKRIVSERAKTANSLE